MTDNAKLFIRKMADGTVDISVQSARIDGSAPMGIINMPSKVFEVLAREMAEPGFESFEWEAS